VLGKKASIIGVVQNYNFEGLQQAIRPLLLEVNVSKFMFFSLRLNNQNIPESINKVKIIWDTFFPEKVYTYKFLDTELQQSYEAEQHFGNLIKFFSLLAILISALGLFGLSAYVGHQKLKEAGVRKVLGANTAQVYFTFSQEYIVLLLIASVSAAPPGYWIAEKWLSNFAFHIPITWLPFATSFLCAVIVVGITTVFQTYRTASVNPVDTLRSE
jgi:putative ABC transport system permease protein